jgi:hypothetical protein
MPPEIPLVISGAVEGPVDEIVMRKLVDEAGGNLERVYGKNGKSHLRQRLSGFNQAARHAPWVVVVDLDHSAECAPPFCQDWLPHPSAHMCFRVAVREIEAWLLADRERLARFLSIASGRVPANPEALDDPKLALVNLARHSRRKDIREDMVPRPSSGREVGPAYTSRVIEFVESQWRPEVAAHLADSLRRCRLRLRGLIADMNAELVIPQ